jgi:hypothetical protein
MIGLATAFMTDLTSCLLIYLFTQCQASRFTGTVNGKYGTLEKITDLLVICRND